MSDTIPDSPPDSAFVRADAKPGVLSGLAFLELWHPQEVATAMAADPVLLFNCLRAVAQNSVNLGSSNLTALLSLAVSKGALTADRAAQIAAGIPPA